MENHRKQGRFFKYFLPYGILVLLLAAALWPKGAKKDRSPKTKQKDTTISPLFNGDLWKAHAELEDKWMYPNKNLDLNPQKYKEIASLEDSSEEEWNTSMVCLLAFYYFLELREKFTYEHTKNFF